MALFLTGKLTSGSFKMRMQSFIADNISSILSSLSLIIGLEGASLPVASSKRVWIFVVKLRAILSSSVLRPDTERLCTAAASD